MQKIFYLIYMNDLLLKLGHLSGASRFRRISEKLYVDGDQIYKDAGIDFKASWFPVYFVLANSNAPLTITTISQLIGFTHITVKNVLRELSEAELIVIKANPDDKRSKIAGLSIKGLQLLEELEPIWAAFSMALQSIFHSAHPDFQNILNRVDREINSFPIHERVKNPRAEAVYIMDYRPQLKPDFYRLAGNWLLGVIGGKLEADDKFSLHHPDKAYLETGGFVFFAQYREEIVGCVALKRLDDNSFEFAKLFIDPNYRSLGIGTKLIERCMSRCKENFAEELWLQSTMSMPPAHRLYYKIGFDDRDAPPQMLVYDRTEKIMCIDL